MEPSKTKHIDRRYATELGLQAVEIMNAGHYTVEGKRVNIADSIKRAVVGTQTFSPQQNVLLPAVDQVATSIRVVNQTTLEAASELWSRSIYPLALNFASAKNPGGGFLNGSRAQEESLARSSGLYACLVGNPMYDYHRRQRNAMYSDFAIYSPDVPVFRDDDGTLLPSPYFCSFITCAAVNAKALKLADKHSNRIANAMRSRITRVLSIAAEQNHSAIILGAWGCGAFGNRGDVIAQIFHNALTSKFRGVFAEVVFAVTDWSKERKFIGPFADTFTDS